jgi:arylsulfatase A-like enzyme
MDRNLARIIDALEAKVGTDYLLAVTADHGMPSAQPGSRHFAPDVVDLLHQQFDPQAKQLVTVYEPENAQMFIDEDRLSHLGVTLDDLARFLEAQSFVFAVFTHNEVRRAAEALRR